MTRLHPHQLPIVRQLNDVIRSIGLDDLPDAELLDRFARYGDQPAFEVLLQRHGPMVFGVCRRLLLNRADAEDAFQASFLVLVRKARTLNRSDRLGPWLYGVAYRVAQKARCRIAQVATRRSEVTDMIPDPTPPFEVPDWLPILDAELNTLPAKYRDPLVLCELQGSSRAEAAKLLKIPEGTLSSQVGSPEAGIFCENGSSSMGLCFRWAV
jgi:RNA polymerase sigma factor (sigma-70 family)